MKGGSPYLYRLPKRQSNKSRSQLNSHFKDGNILNRLCYLLCDGHSQDTAPTQRCTYS